MVLFFVWKWKEKRAFARFLTAQVYVKKGKWLFKRGYRDASKI